MNSAETRWRIGELLDRRRIDAARELLASALRQSPDDRGLLYEAARADYLQDRHDDARQLLQQLLASDPSDLAARYLLFWICCDGQDGPEAERLIIELARQSPQNPDYWAAYAHLMLRCLQFTKASALCTEALKLDAEHPFALRVRVLCDLVEQRGNSEALRRLLLDNPDDAQTLRLVTLALVHRGRHREALRLGRELLRSHPEDQSLVEYLRELAFLNHWSMAPLRPLQRFGWVGVAGTWLGMLLLGRVVQERWPEWSDLFYLSWLSFVIYSWAWPPLLRRWLNRGD